MRLGAHRIADYIYEKLTGEKGVFSTRIAYVTRAGSRYTLQVADADGVNEQLALEQRRADHLARLVADGSELAYVSFEKQKAVVYVQNVATGERRSIADFRGSNSAPAWSPDGQTLAVTLSRDGGSQIFLMGRDGENPRRITSSSAIDTEAEFSADGRSIYFVSDRGGSPQIYRMAAGGGGAERVTFTGALQHQPRGQPRRAQLAYVTRTGNAFRGRRDRPLDAAARSRRS